MMRCTGSALDPPGGWPYHQPGGPWAPQTSRNRQDPSMLTLPPPPLLTLLPAADPAVQADVVIRGATLYDGSGQPGQKGDLAIRGDRIVAVGNFTTTGKP